MSALHRWLPFCVFFLMTLGFAMIIAVPVAMAAPADGVIDILPVADAVIAIVGVALFGVAGWVARAVTYWLGLKSDSVIRRYVQEALERGAEYAMFRAREYAREHGTVAIRNEVLEIGVEYVVKAVPDGLKQLGIDDAAVRRMIDARLAERGPAS